MKQGKIWYLYMQLQEHQILFNYFGVAFLEWTITCHYIKVCKLLTPCNIYNYSVIKHFQKSSSSTPILFINNCLVIHLKFISI